MDSSHEAYPGPEARAKTAFELLYRERGQAPPEVELLVEAVVSASSFRRHVLKRVRYGNWSAQQVQRLRRDAQADDRIDRIDSSGGSDC